LRGAKGDIEWFSWRHSIQGIVFCVFPGHRFRLVGDNSEMINLVEEKRSELADLCREHHVRRLELFGSAAAVDSFDPAASDLDFLVEFERTDQMNPAQQYFGLLESLKRLFGREIDLVTVRSLRNPYFIESVNASRESVYAA